MLIVAPVREELRIPLTAEQQQLFGIEKLKLKRSELPAITHVDYSARIQTVHAETNPRYYALLKAFERRTGCGVLVNTSFNVRGEPIVGTPTTRIAASCAPRWTTWSSRTSCSTRREQPPWEERRFLAKRIRARLSGAAMTAPHSIPELDRKGLRDFGLVTGGIVAVLVRPVVPVAARAAVAALAVGRVRRARRLGLGRAARVAARLSRLDALRAAAEQGHHAADPRHRVLPRHLADRAACAG